MSIHNRHRPVKPRPDTSLSDEERAQSDARQAEIAAMRAAANPALVALRADRGIIGDAWHRLGIDLDDPLVKAVYRVIACAERTLLDVEQATSALHRLDTTITRYP